MSEYRAKRRWPEWVPNAPIREAVLRAVQRGETNYSQLAVRCGWTRSRAGSTFGETTRLKRHLGLAMSYDAKGDYTLTTETMRYDVAVKIVDALGLDPVDFDL